VLPGFDSLVHNVRKIIDAVHIEINELRSRLNELDRDKTYVVYCAVSMRGYLVYRNIVQNGFNAKVLRGGFRTWWPQQDYP